MLTIFQVPPPPMNGKMRLFAGGGSGGCGGVIQSEISDIVIFID